MVETIHRQQKWFCPNCSAPAHAHGKGECGSPNPDAILCHGFRCTCDDIEHGTGNNKCPKAACHHCGWSGSYPQTVRQALDEFRKKFAGKVKVLWLNTGELFYSIEGWPEGEPDPSIYPTDEKIAAEEAEFFGVSWEEI